MGLYRGYIGVILGIVLRGFKGRLGFRAWGFRTLKGISGFRSSVLLAVVWDLQISTCFGVQGRSGSELEFFMLYFTRDGKRISVEGIRVGRDIPKVSLGV